MDIILAGYNIDYDTIQRLAEERLEPENLTPETISAAYARISRSPKSVSELRAIARSEVEKARQSNRNIVFDMGHSSIAEHAVFNIDVIGVSRLLVEAIEKFRLCSYTEKSQRYVLLSDDFVVPEEVRAAGLSERFIRLIESQNRLYHDLYGEMRPLFFSRNADLAEDPRNHTMIEGWAKEDARYIVSMATQTQLGMTINARNLELVLRRMAAHPLAEANEYGRRLHDVVKPIAPSLIRYTEKTDYDHKITRDLSNLAAAFLPKISETTGRFPSSDPTVRLIVTTPDADDRVAAALLAGATGRPMADCLDLAAALTPAEKRIFFKTAFQHMKSHDAAPRELECADLTFELIVSASCFAQLKRHRMATLLSRNYDPDLGVTIPDAVREAGMDKAFLEIIRQTETLYTALLKSAPIAAEYCLTNAHRKRVLMKMNARELYHIARLRADHHAQWDIRNLAGEMIRQAREVMPLTLMMATGKDGYAPLYNETYRD